MVQYKGTGTEVTGDVITPQRAMTKYVTWLRTQFSPLTLATPQATIEQCVENAIRYWNTHSGYKIIKMFDCAVGTARVQLSTDIKTVAQVYPSSTTTWIWNDHPLWTLLGISILDNVTGDLILMSEAFRNYRIYVGTDFRWTWVKSEDPDEEGGWIYPVNIPHGVEKLCVVGTKRVQEDEDIKQEYILDWILNYSLALLKEIEGNTLRKVQGVVPSIRSDGPDIVTEGRTDKKELQEHLARDSRWLAFAQRG